MAIDIYFIISEYLFYNNQDDAAVEYQGTEQPGTIVSCHGLVLWAEGTRNNQCIIMQYWIRRDNEICQIPNTNTMQMD
eukprot:SAG31_NODE_7385_length_1703_cov_2.999377_2_plen_78_part_00